MTHRYQKQFTEELSFVLLPCVFSGCDIAREILTQEDDEPLVPDTAANVNGAQFREATAPKD